MIKRKDIDGELRLIPNSETDYICSNGYVYRYLGNNFYKKINMVQYTPPNDFKFKKRYMRTKVNTTSGTKVFSNERLVANAFVPNPKNLDYLINLDGNPANVRADNLKWVPGYVVNGTGIRVCVFTPKGTKLGTYFSIGRAAAATHVSPATIVNHCNLDPHVRPCRYTFRYLADFEENGFRRK